MAKYTFIDGNIEQVGREAGQLYEYFSNSVKTESPQEVIEHFRLLFIEGKREHNETAYSSLKKIVASERGKREFISVLNHCCQIMVAHWFQESNAHFAISELVSLLNSLSSSEISSLRKSDSWQNLLEDYYKTESYLKLQRLAIVVNPHIPIDNSQDYLSSLLCRYPFLYKHCILSQDSTNQERKNIRNLKNNRRNCFQVAFVKYITYKIRLIQIARARQLTQGAGKILPRCQNPTLLNEEELDRSIRYFVKRVKTTSTRTIDRSSYEVFKDTLYEYLVVDFDDSQWDRIKFHERLFQLIHRLLPEHNSQPLNEFILLQTCSKILHFILGDILQPNQDHDYLFKNLVYHLGAIRTVYLLLKIILICPKVKPYLEEKIARVFEAYESLPITEVTWLINFLETLMVAYSIYFEKMDLSIFKL